MTTETCSFTLDRHRITSTSEPTYDETHPASEESSFERSSSLEGASSDEMASFSHHTSDEPSPVDTIWECPHPVHHGGQCVFHCSSDEVDTDVVQEVLLETLQDESTVPEFRGAQLEELVLPDAVIERSDGATLDFSHSLVDGETDLSGVQTNTALSFEGATIRGEVNLADCSVSGDVNCRSAKFGDRVFLDGAVIHGNVLFDHAEGGFLRATEVTSDGDVLLPYSSWNANVSLATSTVGGDLDAKRAEFQQKLDLTQIDIGGETTLEGGTVKGETRLNTAELHGGLTLRDGWFEDDIDMEHSTVRGDIVGDYATIDGTLSMESGKFGSDRVSFEMTEFCGVVHAPEATFNGKLNCQRSRFDDNVWFVLADMPDGADFRGSTFSEGSESAQAGAHFREVTFGGPAIFRDVTFEDQSFFFNAEFQDDADFSGASFRHFQFGATVRGTATFSKTLFNERAIFENSTFDGPAQFDSAMFEYSADFSGSVFESTADFYETRFRRELDFEDVQFAKRPIDIGVSLKLGADERLRCTGKEFDLTGESDVSQLPLQLDGDHADLTKDGPLRAINTKHDLVQMASRRAYALFKDTVELMQAASEFLEEESSFYLVGVNLSSKATEKHNPDDLPVIITHSTLFAAFTLEGDEQISIAHVAPDVGRINYVIPIQPSQHPSIITDGVGGLSGGQLLAALIASLDRRVELMSEDEQRYSYEMLRPIVIGASIHQELG